MPELSDETPLSPEASLALIAAGQEAAHRRLDVDPVTFLAPWGVAWLVGYGLLFLRFGPDERVLVAMPTWLPLAVLYGLLVVAGIVNGVAVSSAAQGVAGDSDQPYIAPRSAGVWLSALNAVGVLAGPGWHSLVVSVLGGGAMLATALYLRTQRHERARSAARPRATSVIP